MSNVMLIEPNDVNINTNIVNGIPQYQDMYIFAELTAVRRGRTVLVTTGSNLYNAEPTGLENTTRINLLGVNQTKENPNFLNFTTNYYDGSSGNEVQYEGFGMTNIQVVVNSSFIPQVNVQFVDVRGLAFFNREDSPYRILFDFPPPLFRLTIKGYYGKPLTYDMHLVKYTTEFKADNGNFVIDAQFVAITYAPLSDILFRYITNFPYMVENTFASPDTLQPPRNTFELITKLRNLYSAISNNLKSDTDSQVYDTTLRQISQNEAAFAVLGAFRENLAEKGIPYVFTKEIVGQTNTFNLSPNENNFDFFSNYNPIMINPPTTDNEEAHMIPLGNIFEYDTTVKEFAKEGFSKRMNKRLFIGYVSGTNISPVLESPTDSKKDEALLTYRNKILSSAKETQVSVTINDSDISKTITFNNNYDITKNSTNPSTSTKYIAIDVTDLYVKLYKERFELEKSKNDSINIINTKINNKILENLGMNPTIYNIFKIIMDDVDTFFNILRNTSQDAENRHHVQYRDLILDRSYYSDSNDKIFAFPLIVDRQKEICGGYREERIAPIELSKRLPEKFPELRLVDEFIMSFQRQEATATLLSMKSEQDADGRYKWIPISPFDSVLGSSDVVSPYYGIDTTSGEPVNIDGDPRIIQILKIMLRRYYILSQSTLNRDFYRDEYINLYAQSEAINLATSFSQSNYGNLLKDFAQRYNTINTVNNFYRFLDLNVNDYYRFTPASKTSFPVSRTTNAYIDKTNSGYTGMRIYTGDIVEQPYNDNADNKIATFQKTIRRSWFKRVFVGRLPESFYLFTQENVMYVVDDFVKDSTIKENRTEKYNGLALETRYLGNGAPINVVNDTTGFNRGKSEVIEEALIKGNETFASLYGQIGIQYPENLKSFNNICDLWAQQLSNYDDDIFSSISGVSKLSAVILLSNFGYTLGMFNVHPYALNRYVFQNAAAIEVPNYLPLYIGALIGADETGLTNELKNFFISGAGKNMSSRGYYIFADISDIKSSLSFEDARAFKAYFDAFYTSQFATILTQFNYMYQKVKDANTSNRRQKRREYEKLLDPNKTGTDGFSYYNRIIVPLLNRVSIITFSQDTFTKIPAEPRVGYFPISVLNEVATFKNANDKFFSKFFTTLIDEIEKKETEDKEKEEERKKIRGDEDIITQTYYSFKNINDKWLTNPTYPNVNGYPFNNDKPSLISSFAFIDRAMNPIGDTMINAEILLDLFEDHNATIFTVISQLLSTNGFEFFPLQNFLKYENDEWYDSFKIDTGAIKSQQPAFVCMYVGGTSSYPTGIKNGFVDDGIVDLGSTDAKDFTTSDCPTRNFADDNQTQTNTTFPWREVRAFKVRFGEQNQSMFTDIKIDSKEYPETNESIQILSRIAGDNKLEAPIPKGQNLYNLYENRAYKATVLGLGNAMIQPTQYFQLENVPIFNGAYLILGVEHQIVPNRMTTSFSGTKILRFPVPRVTNPAALFGFEGGSSENTDFRSLSPGQITQRFGTAQNINIDKAKYNSMYTFNIE